MARACYRLIKNRQARLASISDHSFQNWGLHRHIFQKKMTSIAKIEYVKQINSSLKFYFFFIVHVYLKKKVKVNEKMKLPPVIRTFHCCGFFLKLVRGLF